jgi:pyridoxine 4-dehydrogenase
MSGYLPPHSREGPASEVFKPEYDLESESIDADDSMTKEYSIFLPAGRTPTTRSRIILNPDSEAPLTLPVLGFGLWGWGDVLSYGWGPSGGYDQKLNENSIKSAFDAIVERFPLILFDTAEHYGYTDGFSESMLGKFHSSHTGTRNSRERFVVATKYFPTPWRHPWRYPDIVLKSLSGSLDRLKLDSIDIYQLHGPSHWGFWPRLSTLVASLAHAYRSGRAKTIGTCNLSLPQVRYVFEELKKQGVPMVSNQVEFSLVRMDPWKTGLIEGCRKLGVSSLYHVQLGKMADTIHVMQVATVAYSPLAVGRLTGKYSSSNRPRGNRSFGDVSWGKIQPIVNVLTEVGQQVGKSPAAVALNWVMCKGAIPIPTCKNSAQVEDCAHALGWRLSAEQEDQLDKVGRVDDWDLNILKHFQNWWWEQG